VTTFVVTVAAAVIDQDGRVLLTRRLKGTHLAGLWEFPGGKCEAGESVADCLRRELREELGVEAVIGQEILVTRHDYPDRRVELHFLECTIDGAATPLLGQEMRWAPHTDLPSLEFPPADAELIQMLARR
jgi:8-oxo-dGTP diphosphatase